MGSISGSGNENRQKLPPDKPVVPNDAKLYELQNQQASSTSSNSTTKNDCVTNSSSSSLSSPPKPPKHYASFIQGTMAAMCGKGTTAPLDRLKILIQTRHTDYKDVGCFKRNQGIGNALYRICKTDGWIGLYRGNHVALVRHGLHGGLGFYIHDNLHRIAKEHGRNKISTNIVIGSCSGVGATILTFPLDTLRVMIATNQGSLRSIYKKYGMKKLIFWRLYSGCGSGLMGVIPYAGLNFGIRDTLRDWLYYSDDYREHCFDERGIPGWKTSFLLGFVTGIITQFLTYPIEVLKRRRQNSALGYRELVVEMRIHGLSSMYRGFSLNIIRHPICNALVWGARDFFIRYNIP